jgi:hypothetical protein
MADWSKMRKKWTDNRDAHGVKKGAVSGVSVGDAIDKVMKTESKGYNPLYAACTALDSALTKYKAKIAKTHPDFVKWIDKNIQDDLDDLAADVFRDIHENLKWVTDDIAREQVYSIQALIPDCTMLPNVEKLLTAKPPKTWDEAVAEVSMFTKTFKAAPEVATRATKLKTLKWYHVLPGHDGDYKMLTGFADILLADVKYCLLWSKVTNRSGFQQFQRDMNQRDNAITMSAKLAAAIKSLLG